MIRYEDLPDDPKDLARLDIHFPPLPADEARRCPVSVEDMKTYLRAEGIIRSSPDDLKLVYTASVEDKSYWLWQFLTYYGDEAYVIVSRKRDGQIYYGYVANDYLLTFDQILLGDFYKMF